MFPIQPGTVHGADEKLTAIGIRAGVCHTQDTCGINDPKTKSNNTSTVGTLVDVYPPTT